MKSLPTSSSSPISVASSNPTSDNGLLSTSKSILSKVLFNVSEDVLAGAFAGLVARALTAPFDVLKIRYQLLCRRVTQTPSMYQAFKTIVQEEGIRALWKGNLAATYLWISYGVVQFGVYGAMKDWFDSDRLPVDSNKEKSRPTFSLRNKALLMFIAGSIAGNEAGGSSNLINSIPLYYIGTAATIATYPFDIMRTQFAVQGKTKAFTSIASYVGQTYKTYGIRGSFFVVFLTVS